jgi:hypothetical protein
MKGCLPRRKYTQNMPKKEEGNICWEELERKGSNAVAILLFFLKDKPTYILYHGQF